MEVADGRKYFFDFVFGPESTQEHIYRSTAKPLLAHFIDGFNCTILAYGQTGSGKTFTMGTDAEGLQSAASAHIGILPRLAEDMFSGLRAAHTKSPPGTGAGGGSRLPGFSVASGDEVSIQCQFLEVYNHEIRDLLAAGAAPAATDTVAGGSKDWSRRKKPKMPEVTLRENGSDIVVSGAVKREVQDLLQLMTAFHAGCSARTTGAALDYLSERLHVAHFSELSKAAETTMHCAECSVSRECTYLCCCLCLSMAMTQLDVENAILHEACANAYGSLMRARLQARRR